MKDSKTTKNEPKAEPLIKKNIKDWTKDDLQEWLKGYKEGVFKEYMNLFAKHDGDTFSQFTQQQLENALKNELDASAMFNAKEALLKASETTQQKSDKFNWAVLDEFEQQIHKEYLKFSDLAASPVGKTREAIHKLQKEKWPLLKDGEIIPCNTNSVHLVGMLYGERVQIPTNETLDPYLELNSNIGSEESNMHSFSPIGLRLRDLLVDPVVRENNRIYINIQMRGAGKTKEIHDLALADNRPVLYIDFTTTESELVKDQSIDAITALPSVKAYLRAIRMYIASPPHQLNEVAVQCTILLVCAKICSLKLWYDLGKRSWTLTDFLRLSKNGLDDIVAQIFNMLLKYDYYSIVNTVSEWLKNEKLSPIIAYDEAGELLRTNVFPPVFPSRLNPTEVGKSLFDAFAEALVQMKKQFAVHQIICGTTLKLTKLVGGRLSPWKKNEVMVVCPLKPFSPSCISADKYFDGLKISSDTKTRFASRGRIVFEYLVEKIIIAAEGIANLDALQQKIDKQLDTWFDEATQQIKAYIVAAINENEGKIIGAKDAYHVNTTLSLMVDIYHDVIFKRGKRFLSVENGVPYLVDLGLIFFEVDHQNSKNLKGNLVEKVACVALADYFASKEPLKDPLLKYLYKSWKDESSKPGNSGMGLESYCAYTLIRSLTPLPSVASSPILKPARKDRTLSCYKFEAFCFVKEQALEQKLEKFLETRPTDYILSSRDKEGGPDKLIWLRKCSSPPQLPNDDPLLVVFPALPLKRLWIIQDKDMQNLKGKLGHKALQSVWFEEIPYGVTSKTSKEEKEEVDDEEIESKDEKDEVEDEDEASGTDIMDEDIQPCAALIKDANRRTNVEKILAQNLDIPKYTISTICVGQMNLPKQTKFYKKPNAFERVLGGRVFVTFPMDTLYPELPNTEKRQIEKEEETIEEEKKPNKRKEKKKNRTKGKITEEQT